MPPTPPGETRKRILEFVRQRLLAADPPTLREIQKAFGFRAIQTVKEHMDALVEANLLTRSPGLARGCRLPGARGEAPVSLVPLLGRVPAGPLSEAIERPEGHLPVRARPHGAPLFALRVRGDSMSRAGILDGDVVIVRSQPSAEPGSIVVARVGDEATVKRLRVVRGRFELHPENPAYRPIVPEDGALTILGRVIEVRRELPGPAPSRARPAV